MKRNLLQAKNISSPAGALQKRSSLPLKSTASIPWLIAAAMWPMILLAVFLELRLDEEVVALQLLQRSAAFVSAGWWLTHPSEKYESYGSLMKVMDQNQQR